MGSTGSGTFSDYHGHRGNRSAQGGESNEDKCEKAFSTDLEDVENCSYFKNNQNVPPVGTAVTVIFNDLRLEVIDDNKECVGYLPTKFNYLRTCLEDDFGYGGVISSSSLTPIVSITVDISPF